MIDAEINAISCCWCGAIVPLAYAHHIIIPPMTATGGTVERPLCWGCWWRATNHATYSTALTARTALRGES